MATTPLPRSRSNPPARARWATVRLETDEAVYVGRLCVPETKKRVSDVLGDDRAFVYLTEVRIDDGVAERFVAVNKRYVRTVRVLEAGDDDALGDPYGFERVLPSLL